MCNCTVVTIFPASRFASHVSGGRLGFTILSRRSYFEIVVDLLFCFRVHLVVLRPFNFEFTLCCCRVGYHIGVSQMSAQGPSEASIDLIAEVSKDIDSSAMPPPPAASTPPPQSPPPPGSPARASRRSLARTLSNPNNFVSSPGSTKQRMQEKMCFMPRKEKTCRVCGRSRLSSLHISVV